MFVEAVPPGLNPGDQLAEATDNALALRAAGDQGEGIEGSMTMPTKGLQVQRAFLKGGW